MNQIEAFVDVASRYCALIDHHTDYDVEDFLNRVREILPLLYYHALQLPDRESNDEKIERSITHEQWQSVYDSIGKLPGRNSLYWKLFDPISEPLEPPVATTISDDLADIWRDLVIGVKLWLTVSESIRHAIVWQWRFSFQSHWSNHLVDTMRAINWLTESYGIRESEDAV